jgi:hypothetical protein
LGQERQERQERQEGQINRMRRTLAFVMGQLMYSLV